jgi:hypothetical protein
MCILLSSALCSKAYNPRHVCSVKCSAVVATIVALTFGTWHAQTIIQDGIVMAVVGSCMHSHSYHQPGGAAESGWTPQCHTMWSCWVN